jgi:regulator of sirC expression with transglutaminase-like and TPR domain
MEKLLNSAKKAYIENNLDESMMQVNAVLELHPQYVEALLLRAMIYQKQQIWGSAINDLNMVLELEPENKVANSLKTIIVDIIRFWNKDSFNP